MLLIIPSIDLTNGHALRCVMGVPGTERLYSELSDHPVELAQLWRRENAKCIHVTDLDSWKGADTTANIATAIAMQKAVDIPIQLLTRQPTVSAYRSLLEAGIYRVGVSSVVFTDPDGVRELIDEYGSSRVIFGVRAHNGDVDCGQSVGMVADEEFIRAAYELGGRRIVYTEVDWEGKLTGEDLDVIIRIASVAKVRITMAGGIASPQHLWMLQNSVPRNVDSVVIGRAMYENRFPCQNIWRSIEAELEPEIHAHAHEVGQQSSISKLGGDF
ncbi:MAG: HisA/HisF-related TIM barrel protein [Candidatus Kapabacteria bacterium]|nr:HisA/HisF-related TIM barrel protein [Candidatus Kapabacteria bacterium]